ncbi:MAG: tetratricopeptide repeat protein, partial [Solirubrobacteraceae bacterium]
SNLGLLLERQGDWTAAAAAYRRADQRGDAIGAFNLAVALEERGDITAAVAAYQRADQLGHAQGADEWEGAHR